MKGPSATAKHDYACGSSVERQAHGDHRHGSNSSADNSRATPRRG